jgi:alpha-soluble NSF attachment protein
MSQAANCYKLQQNWQKAIDCYLDCVSYCTEEAEHATYLLDAAHAAKKISASKYLELGKRAIDAYCLSGRISSAAGLAKEIAESLEEEYDFEEAVSAYEKAAELYNMEE